MSDTQTPDLETIENEDAPKSDSWTINIKKPHLPKLPKPSVKAVVTHTAAAVGGAAVALAVATGALEKEDSETDILERSADVPELTPEPEIESTEN